MRPDGDCVSSEFVLARILRRAGAADVVCLNQNPLPSLYENFSCGEKLLGASDFSDGSYSVIIVDCADYARTNARLVERFPKPFAAIDHHITNNPAAEINILDPKAAATAELVAGMAFDCGVRLEKSEASCLYMGIATDTRQFTTSSTRAKTFEIAAALINAGADCAGAAVQLYQREKFAKLKLLGKYIGDLELYDDGKICIGSLSKKDFLSAGANKEDSDGLIDYARSVAGVEIAILLEELDDGVKGSLRGKSPGYSVNEIASVFGGGGHLAAAGFTAKGETLESFRQKIVELAADHLKKTSIGNTIHGKKI